MIRRVMCVNSIALSLFSLLIIKSGKENRAKSVQKVADFDSSFSCFKQNIKGNAICKLYKQ